MTTYTVELFRPGGEGAGIERELARAERLDAAWALYREAIARHPGRLIMLCDRARVVARNDR